MPAKQRGDRQASSGCPLMTSLEGLHHRYIRRQ